MVERHKRSRKTIAKKIVLLGFVLMSLTACVENVFQKGDEKVVQKEEIDTGFELTGPNSYDSEDTPIVMDINQKEHTITFLNRIIGRRYTLDVDGTTKLYDKYGESISLAQIQKGDVVDVRFLKSKKHLTQLQLAEGSWTLNDVKHYEIDAVRGEATIGEEVFKLGEYVKYFSEGKLISAEDLNTVDSLRFEGIDNEIVSVTVEKGHGYLRLTNDEHFIGGWIEIGQLLVQQITEEMLLPIPEGNYAVSVSHKGNGDVKNVVIRRNEETVLDLGDIEIEEPEYGTVLFTLKPSDAKVFIDGEEVDTSAPLELEYGIHQLIAKATGYHSITTYLRVVEKTAAIDVVLDRIGDSEQTKPDNAEKETDETGETSTSSVVDDTLTGYCKVYVDAPEGVEVYLDGNYVGISPCNFQKNVGTHVITLRKNGYESRSYNIQIGGEKKDFSFSFADLVPEGTTSAVGEPEEEGRKEKETSRESSTKDETTKTE